MMFVEQVQQAEVIVADIQKQLPVEIRPLASHVTVHYEGQPDASVLAAGMESDILGLFSGHPHGTEFNQSDPSPPQIMLYLDNIWDLAEGDPAAFCAEVRLTYLHELGHYFGWDEEDLAARGLD